MTVLKYEIKTHKLGRIYNKPHFYLLNKGLNSGRPMNEPCPNCFVVTTESKEQRESLFYLSISLKIGRYFSFYLKGSVIPFISISDANTVLKNAIQNYEEHQWKEKIERLKLITSYEENLLIQLKKIKDLKVALLRT